MPLLEMYAQQLPRLEARESLRRAHEIAVGTGSLERNDQRRLMSQWQREADGDDAGAGRPPASLAAAASAFGIPLVRQPGGEQRVQEGRA